MHCESLVQATQAWVALQCAAPVPVQLVSERHCTHTLVPGSQYGLGGAHVPLVVQGVPPAASAAPSEPPKELASAPPDELPEEEPLPLLDAVASYPAPEPVPDDAPELAPLDPPSGETVPSLPEPPQPIPIAIIKDTEESTLDGFMSLPWNSRIVTAAAIGGSSIVRYLELTPSRQETGLAPRFLADITR